MEVPCTISGNNAMCTERSTSKLYSNIEIYAVYTKNHHEERVNLSGEILQKIQQSLQRCNHALESVCNMKVPKTVYLLKFHVVEEANGEFNIQGVYMKENTHKQRSVLKVGFLIKKSDQRNRRQVIVVKPTEPITTVTSKTRRPLNNYQRIDTTPKGLVVIGVIKATKKPPRVTKSLGVIKATKRPAGGNKRNISLKKIVLRSRNRTNSLKTIVHKVIEGFKMVERS